MGRECMACSGAWDSVMDMRRKRKKRCVEGGENGVWRENNGMPIDVKNPRRENQ